MQVQVEGDWRGRNSGRGMGEGDSRGRIGERDRGGRLWKKVWGGEASNEKT